MAAECKIKNELGTISVVEDVITTVAGYAAIECIGIVAMASKRATDGLVELLGRENLKRRSFRGQRVHQPVYHRGIRRFQRGGRQERGGDRQVPRGEPRGRQGGFRQRHGRGHPRQLKRDPSAACPGGPVMRLA